MNEEETEVVKERENERTGGGERRPMLLTRSPGGSAVPAGMRRLFPLVHSAAGCLLLATNC